MISVDVVELRDVVVGIGAQVGGNRPSQLVQQVGEYLTWREGIVLDLVDTLIVAQARRRVAPSGVIVIEIGGVEIIAGHGGLETLRRLAVYRVRAAALTLRWPILPPYWRR